MILSEAKKLRTLSWLVFLIPMYAYKSPLFAMQQSQEAVYRKSFGDFDSVHDDLAKKELELARAIKEDRYKTLNLVLAEFTVLVKTDPENNSHTNHRIPITTIFDSRMDLTKKLKFITRKNDDNEIQFTCGQENSIVFDLNESSSRPKYKLETKNMTLSDMATQLVTIFGNKSSPIHKRIEGLINSIPKAKLSMAKDLNIISTLCTEVAAKESPEDNNAKMKVLDFYREIICRLASQTDNAPKSEEAIVIQAKDEYSKLKNLQKKLTEVTRRIENNEFLPKRKINNFCTDFCHSETRLIKYLLDPKSSIWEEINKKINSQYRTLQDTSPEIFANREKDKIKGVILHIHSRYNYCHICRCTLIMCLNIIKNNLMQYISDSWKKMTKDDSFFKLTASFRVHHKNTDKARKFLNQLYQTQNSPIYSPYTPTEESTEIVKSENNFFIKFTNLTNKAYPETDLIKNRIWREANESTDNKHGDDKESKIGF